MDFTFKYVENGRETNPQPSMESCQRDNKNMIENTRQKKVTDASLEIFHLNKTELFCILPEGLS